jgi:predicted ribosomally synthesized peptide with SipW-like signal peptide
MTHEFDLSRREALAALGTVGAASAGAGLGTSAFFSDQETFENNQLTAGTLDMGVGYTAHYADWSDDEADGLSGGVRLFEGAPNGSGTAADLRDDEVGFPTTDAWHLAVDEDDADAFLDNTLTGAYPNVGTADDPEQGVVACVDGEATPQADAAPRPVIDVTDVKPGDFGEVTFDFVLCDNPGYVWVTGALRDASENGTTEPEADDPDERADGVELLDVIRTAVWIDDGGDGPGGNADGNNYHEAGEELVATGSLRAVLGLGTGHADTGLDVALNGALPARQGGGTGRNCFAAETSHSLAFAWWVPIDHGNELQTDAAAFDLGLYAEQCRHNDGSGQRGVPTDVAEAFLDRVAVAGDSHVFFAGPVAPGLRLVEPALDPAERAVLQVPETPGEYFAFFVDDLPAFGFEHPVRYAWLDAESGAFEVVTADWPPVVLDEEQLLFDYGGPVTVDGRRVFYADDARRVPVQPPRGSVQTSIEGFRFLQQEDPEQGQDQGPPHDIGDKPNPFTQLPAEVRSIEAVQGVVNPPAADEVQPLPDDAIPEEELAWPEHQCYAIVVDGGETETGDGHVADVMAQEASEVAAWLRANGFDVLRLSQYWGNAHPALGEVLNEETTGRTIDQEWDRLLAAYGTAFQHCCAQLRSGSDEGDDSDGIIDFFIYIKAHGNLSYHGEDDDRTDDDVDGDGTPNTRDDDIDGDGTPNARDDDIDGPVRSGSVVHRADGATERGPQGNPGAHKTSLTHEVLLDTLTTARGLGDTPLFPPECVRFTIVVDGCWSGGLLDAYDGQFENYRRPSVIVVSTDADEEANFADEASATHHFTDTNDDGTPDTEQAGVDPDLGQRIGSMRDAFGNGAQTPAWRIVGDVGVDGLQLPDCLHRDDPDQDPERGQSAG